MKFVVLIGDGMGDYPLTGLGGRTVLDTAETPNMDWIAKHGRGGMIQTIPPSMQPGSDVANMELLGYDTTSQFTGRAVFEALSMGRPLSEKDVAFRMNLVTLRDGVMEDYSAGHITTEEAKDLVGLIDSKLGSKAFRFYPGVSYRHLMIRSGGPESMETTPPHDIIGRKYEPYLPAGEGSDVLLSIMKDAEPILKDALVNKKREVSGKLPANAVWFWGQGCRLGLETMEEKYGVKGGVISAVDLIRGIGIAAGLKPIFVPGATGYIDTNFKGKGEAAVEALESMDYVYVHVEAPDEAGHNGDAAMKVKAIEDFDDMVVGTVLEFARKREDVAVLVACDHRTPIDIRTHTREPVPFAFFGPGVTPDGMSGYSERQGEHGSISLNAGNLLMNLFIGEFKAL